MNTKTLPAMDKALKLHHRREQPRKLETRIVLKRVSIFSSSSSQLNLRAS
jgi:hypothetical protein